MAFTGGGFLGGGGKSAETSSTVVTSNTSQGVDGDGTAISQTQNFAGSLGTKAKNSTFNIVSTDYGAITGAFNFAGSLAEAALDSVEGAYDVASDAVSLGRAGIDTGYDLARAGLDAGFDLGKVGLSAGETLGRYGVDAGADLADAGLAFAARQQEDQSSFARALFGESLEAVTGVLKEGQAQLGNTVSNLNAIARQNSTSADERVQAIADKALKIGALMVGLIAAAFVFSKVARA